MTDHHQTDPRPANRVIDLPAALRRQAKGMLCSEAAAEVLIGQRAWLARDDFVARFVEIAPAFVDGAPMAIIDWDAAITALGAGRLACSASEDQMLRITASLAVGVPVDLSAVVTGLDADNLKVVVASMAHAGGW